MRNSEAALLDVVIECTKIQRKLYFGWLLIEKSHNFRPEVKEPEVQLLKHTGDQKVLPI